MGTIIKRGDSWRAIIRKRGHRTLTKSFSRMAAARRWVVKTEAGMEHAEIDNTHFDVGQLIRRYRTEIGAIKTWDRPYRANLLRLSTDFDGITIGALDAARLVEWGKGRRVSPATIQSEMNSLAATLRTAETLWRVNVNWAEFRRGRAMLKSLGIYGNAVKRSRRFEEGELEAIKKHFNSTLPMHDLIDFAIASCMRIAEQTRIRWDDVDEERRTVIIRQRKHPKNKTQNDQVVPLLAEAWEILQRQPRIDDRIFPYNPDSVSAAFQRARNAAGVKDLRWHDARHEGISRMFERGFRIEQVAMVSGHASWAELKRYTNLRPHDLHDIEVGLEIKKPA